jgi:hypothetical protein
MLSPDQEQLLQQLIEAEKSSTQGEWRIREHGSDFFVERPKIVGEAYGVEILGEDYETRRQDAQFIVLAKQFILSLNR